MFVSKKKWWVFHTPFFLEVSLTDIVIRDANMVSAFVMAVCGRCQESLASVFLFIYTYVHVWIEIVVILTIFSLWFLTPFLFYELNKFRQEN